MTVVDPVLLICAAQLPECPADTLVSTTPAPEPDVFHPEVSVSKPGFVTRLIVSEAVFVFPAAFPVTVCGPPAVAVHVFPLQDPFGGYFGSPYEPNKAVTSFAVTASQFRFSGVCNVAFVDGHVENRRPIDLPSIAPFNQATWDAAKGKFALGFLSTDDTSYTGQ